MRRPIDLYTSNTGTDEAVDGERGDRTERIDHLEDGDEREPDDLAVTTTQPDRSTLARALNELEAAKARVERDAQLAADELRANLVLELLPLLDNLDRAVTAAEDNADAPAVLEGVRLVRAQFETVLVRYGVERIVALHHAFDPKLHDAVGLAPVGHPEANGRVIDEVAPGYRFGARLLRPAKVIVGRYGPRVH